MNPGERPHQLAIPAAVSAFLIWGLLPIYWKAFAHIDALVVVCHRVIWSLAFLLLIIISQRQWPELRATVSKASIWRASFPAAALIAGNWLLFIWSVQNGHVIDTSLGYFLNPLCNTLLAVIFIGERINRWQGIAIAIAASAILYSFQTQATFPYIALSLAITFSLYALAKKQAKLPAGIGLVIETAILVPFAFAWLAVSASSHVTDWTWVDWILLISAGPMTTIPLFLFSYAAQRTSLITIGMLQYLGPSIGLLIGWLLYQEAMPMSRWISFGLVWLSLAIYTFDLINRRSKLKQLTEAISAAASPVDKD